MNISQNLGESCTKDKNNESNKPRKGSIKLVIPASNGGKLLNLTKLQFF